MNKLKFYFFHLMPYGFVPRSSEFDSSWVTLSNEHYDPTRGHQLYNEYIALLVAAEKYGYDGAIVNEHHANAYGTMPSPNLIAAMVVTRTRRMPVGIVGNAIPLHGNPVRVAEEIAMLDVISGGRIISGFVRGIGCEYFNNPVSPTDSVERFWEANELILKAWTDPGPFTWQGKHYYIPNVNVWPRPIQKPHPPVWLPGMGSLETLRECARNRYTYMMIFAPTWMCKWAFDKLKEEAEICGYELPRDQCMAAIPTYVAETDKQAHREAKAHMQWLFNTGLKIKSSHYFPPGYMSDRSFRGYWSAVRDKGAKAPMDLTYDDLLKQGYIIVGSPQTVAEGYAEYCDELGAGGVLCAGSPSGPMPNWMAVKNMQMFAEEVMPLFREADGKPDYLREEQNIGATNAERAAQLGEPDNPPTAPLQGMDDVADLRTIHLPEMIDGSLFDGVTRELMEKD